MILDKKQLKKKLKRKLKKKKKLKRIHGKVLKTKNNILELKLLTITQIKLHTKQLNI